MSILKSVMVFGVFDCLHDGHRHLIRQAQTMGTLIIVVAPDTVVLELKNKSPVQLLSERIQHLSKEFSEIQIVVGDTELNSWQILLDHTPDIVLLGYDQLDMKQAIQSFVDRINLPIRIEIATSFKPNTYHSSILFKH